MISLVAGSVNNWRYLTFGIYKYIRLLAFTLNGRQICIRAGNNVKAVRTVTKTAVLITSEKAHSLIIVLHVIVV